MQQMASPNPIPFFFVVKNASNTLLNFEGSTALCTKLNTTSPS